MTVNNALEQINLQIQWNRILSVVEEQAQVLVRTAFSTAAREAGAVSYTHLTLPTICSV